MNLLSTLAPVEGSKHYQKRLGRGRGSGLGQTSGKGHKGQLARSGGKVRRGFEGGQSPLSRRLPKFGFSNAKFRNVYQVINLSNLSNLSGDVTPETLIKNGMVKDGKIKVLARGAFSAKINLKVHAVSGAARIKIESCGGSVEVIK